MEFRLYVDQKLRYPWGLFAPPCATRVCKNIGAIAGLKCISSSQSCLLLYEARNYVVDVKPMRLHMDVKVQSNFNKQYDFIILLIVIPSRYKGWRQEDQKTCAKQPQYPNVESESARCGDLNSGW